MDDLRKRVYDATLGKLKQSLSDNRGFVRQDPRTKERYFQKNGNIVSPVPERRKVTPYSQTLSGRINNAYTSALSPLAKAQQFIESPTSTAQYFPKLNEPKPTGHRGLDITKRVGVGGVNLVSGLAGNIFGRGFLDPIIDTTQLATRTAMGQDITDYKDLKSAPAQLAYNIKGFSRNPNEIIENTAGTIEPIFDAYGGGKVFGLGKEAMEQQIKQTFKQAVKQGMKQGAKYGVTGGTLYGLSDREDTADDLKQLLVQGTQSGLIGLGAGTILGGAVAGGGNVLGKIRNSLIDTYKNSNPKATAGEAEKAVKGYIRNRLGQFAQKADEPQYETVNYIGGGTERRLIKPKGEPEFYKQLDNTLGIEDGDALKTATNKNPFGLQAKPTGDIMDAQKATQLPPDTQSGKARTQSKQKLGSDPAFSSSDGSIPKTPTGNPIKDDVTGVNPSGIGTRIREAVQDSWVRVKNLQRQKGATVEDGGNPYLAEELYHGRIGARLEDIKTTVKSIDEDILKTSKEIGVPDAQLKKDVNTYLQALHAPERNKVHGDGAAGMTTKEARAILSQMTKGKTAKQVQRIAGQIKDMNKRTLDVLYEGQVIDKQMYDTLTTTYKNHVPLNRIMDETDNFGDILSGKGFNVKGTGVKRAKGSDKEVADIFTNVVANVEAALVKAEKNRVDLATLKFARNNPQLGIFEEIKPRAIGEGFDGKMLTQQVTDPMVLTLRENGKPVYLKIKDERLAKVFQGIGQERLPDVFRFVNTFTRFYSGLHTRFNPEFALSNVVRDSQEMAVYMASQNNVGFKGAGKAVMDMPKSQKAVIDALRGMDTEGAKLYKQMQMDGGTTGGQALSTRKQVDVDMQEIMRINRSAPKKAAQKILESFDNWNTVFEDGTRLAVYKRALDSGLSREQAASMAKNSTVNFNKKGTAGPIINSMYMFSNASIQGSTKMLRAMKNPKVAGVVITAVGGSVIAVNSWNDSVDPNWRDKVTEWDRNSNMVVMIPSSGGDAKYITIPVSWGIKPIKVAADTAYDLSTGHANDIGDAAVKIASSAFDAYNPAGGTDAMSIVTPTILDTPLDISRNTAWHGGSIKPDWLKGLPGSEQHFKDIEESPSGRIAKGITDKASGMGIEVSPDDLLYAYNAYIGGVGKFATRITNTATSLMQGDDLVAKDVPFINRFYKERSAEQVESSVAYQKEADFMESLKKYETGSEEQKSAIENYLRQRGTKEERQSILFKLRDQGIPTKGISFSAKKLGITDASTDTPFTAPASFEDTDDMPQNIIEKIALAAEGVTKDPKNTIKAIVTQEELRKIEGDAVILKRQDFLNKSDDPSLARDHIIPLGLGGDNSEANLQYVDKDWHEAKTKNDNELIRKLQSGQISRKEAQKQVQTWLEENPVDRYVMDESEANTDVLDTALYDEYDLGFLAKEPMTAVAKAKYEDKKYDKALSIYRDEEIDDDTRSTLLNTIGIDTNDLDYYDVASSENYIKSLHVREEISTIPDNNREQLLQKLAEMRRPVNRKYILADGVITDLVDEGVITKDEGKILKNIDFDSTGKLKVKVSGRGGGAKLKKVKFVPLSVSSAPIQNMNFEGLKTPSGMGQNRLSVPRLQVQNVRPQQQPKFQVKFNL